MGIYLYAIRKLKRAQRITREDGAVLVVAHTLAFVSKPYWDFGTPDRRTRLAMGRVTAAYGDHFTGPVLFGDSVRQWNAASPLWWDTDKLPGTEWAVLTDRVGDEHEARATKARLPTLIVCREGRPVTLEARVDALHGDKYVAAHRLVFATQESATAHVRLRGGPEEVKLSPLASAADVVAEFHAYMEVVRDWLYSVTPVRPAPERKLPAPALPTHEECMRAAGWL